MILNDWIYILQFTLFFNSKLKSFIFDLNTQYTFYNL